MQSVTNMCLTIPKNNEHIKSMWEWFKQAIKPFLTWQYLVCYLIVYFPFTGMWYFWLWLGLKLGIKWLAWLSGLWLGVLWSPFMPEKAFTIPLARKLQKILFERKRGNHA